jgi:dTMP kinase
MPKTLPTPAAPAQDVTRSVLAIKPFRKLWNSMVFSSLGDWLGLLATTAMAQQLSGGDYATANFAIAGVFIARLLPAVFLGPIAGVIADKFDRRKLMVNCDILRAALYISIPIANNYFWLYTAMILVECITLFWSPAKEASVPNLVPREKLENGPSPKKSRKKAAAKSKKAHTAPRLTKNVVKKAATGKAEVV